VAKILQLRLSEPVRQAFARVLDCVLRLDRGSDVADFLGRDPWGDLSAYRREVFNPMQSPGAAVEAESGRPPAVAIALHDLPRINAVLHDFYEGYSGGCPWAGIDDEERAILERLAAQVGG
jgi:hypothetical protein